MDDFELSIHTHSLFYGGIDFTLYLLWLVNSHTYILEFVYGFKFSFINNDFLSFTYTNFVGIWSYTFQSLMLLLFVLYILKQNYKQADDNASLCFKVLLIWKDSDIWPLILPLLFVLFKHYHFYYFLCPKFFLCRINSYSFHFNQVIFFLNMHKELVDISITISCENTSLRFT